MPFVDPNTAANPYSAPAASDQNTLTNMQTNMGSVAQNTSTAQPYQYPSYPNQYGLGTQNPSSGFGGTTSSSSGGGTAYASQPVTVQVPDTTSRGASPWSYLGESNARDTPPPITPGEPPKPG